MLVLAAVGLFAGCAKSEPPPTYAGPKVTLRPQYLPGQYVRTIRVVADVGGTATGQQPPAVHTEQSMEMLIDAAAPEASGQRLLAMSYTAVRVKERGFEFDSDQPPPARKPPDADRPFFDPGAVPGLPESKPPLGKADILRELLKARILLRLGPDGRVLSVEGLDRLWDDLAKANPQSAEELRSVKEQMGDARIQEYFTEVGEAYPDHPVAPGDEWAWRNSAVIPLLGKTAMSAKLHVRDIESTPAGRVAVIVGEGSLAPEAPSSVRLGNGTLSLRRVVIAQTFQERFNLDTGLAEQRTIEMTGTIEGTLSAGGRSVDLRAEPKVTAEFLMQSLPDKLSVLPGRRLRPARAAPPRRGPRTA